MYLEHHIVTITTIADGSGIGYTPDINGFIQAIRYVKDSTNGYTAGVDFNVTAENSGLTIWDQDNVDDSVTVYPREATHDTVGTAALYAAAGTAVRTPIPVCNERIKIEIAAGGDAKTGVFHIYVGG